MILEKKMEYIKDSLNCDASYLWKSKIMEWQVKDTLTGELLVKQKAMGGSSNVAEYLAVIDTMMFQEEQGSNLPIYTDSKIALIWIKQGRCGTWQELPKETEDLVTEYTNILIEIKHNYTVLKWKTWAWGEIPSDFGRKR